MYNKAGPVYGIYSWCIWSPVYRIVSFCPWIALWCLLAAAHHCGRCGRSINCVADRKARLIITNSRFTVSVIRSTCCCHHGVCNPEGLHPLKRYACEMSSCHLQPGIAVRMITFSSIWFLPSVCDTLLSGLMVTVITCQVRTWSFRLCIWGILFPF